MIEKIRIEDYKALRDVTIELTPLHLLIGPNDSGKTSILEAIDALCRSVDCPLSEAFAGPWKGQQLVRSGAQVPVVTITADVADAGGRFHYVLATRFQAPSPGRAAVTEDEMFSAEQVPVHLVHRHVEYSTVYGFRARVWQLVDAQERAVDRIYQGLAGVHYYRWEPRVLALPTAPDASRRFRMDPSGFGLALCLDDILGYDRDLFIKLETRFRQIFPAVKSIKLLPEAAYRAPVDYARPIPMLRESDGKGIYFQFADNGALVPAAQVSDGVLLVLAYLTILNLPEPPRVILIEEPENGIHPKRLEEVLRILRELVQEQRRTQVVLTTHSPYVVDLFAPEEVTLCEKEANGEVSVHRLSSSKTVREQLKLFSLGEIWTSEGDEKIAATAGDGSPAQ